MYRIERRLETLRDGGGQGVLTITDEATNKARRLYVYDRSVSIVWSPDSRHLILNDFAGSDYTDNYIYDTAMARVVLDIRRRITVGLTGVERRRMTANDHVYSSGYKWLGDDTIGVLAYGHGQHDRKGFCACYTVSISGLIATCKEFATPPEVAPEEYCDKMSR
jgi:hypothetical protein